MVDDFPHFLGHSWTQGVRAARLNQLISSESKLSLQDFIEFQLDSFSLKGKEFVAEIMQEFEGAEGVDEDVDLALRIFKQWDYKLDVDSVGGTLYEVLPPHSSFYYVTNMISLGFGSQATGTLENIHIHIHFFLSPVGVKVQNKQMHIGACLGVRFSIFGPRTWLSSRLEACY